MAIWTADGAFALVRVPPAQLAGLIKEVFLGLRVELHFPFKIKECPTADAIVWFSGDQAKILKPTPQTKGPVH